MRYSGFFVPGLARAVTVAGWPEPPKKTLLNEVILGESVKTAAWHRDGLIRSSFLHDLIFLRDQARAQSTHRYRPLLHYQIERNLQGEAKRWARGLLKPESAIWASAEFLVRYAILASKQKEEEGIIAYA